MTRTHVVFERMEDLLALLQVKYAGDTLGESRIIWFPPVSRLHIHGSYTVLYILV